MSTKILLLVALTTAAMIAVSSAVDCTDDQKAHKLICGDQGPKTRLFFSECDRLEHNENLRANFQITELNRCELPADYGVDPKWIGRK